MQLMLNVILIPSLIPANVKFHLIFPLRLENFCKQTHKFSLLSYIKYSRKLILQEKKILEKKNSVAKEFHEF